MTTEEEPRHKVLWQIDPAEGMFLTGSVGFAGRLHGSTWSSGDASAWIAHQALRALVDMVGCGVVGWVERPVLWSMGWLSLHSP